MSKAYLLLENGMVFEGEGFGAAGTRVGELVFTTGMTGCAESLTDPSYRGQLITFTFPMLGNYGICYEDRESPHIHARGVVVREYCPRPSNFRAEVDVDTFLREEGVCGICGVDTRRITQLIRTKGVMNAAVTDAEPDDALLGLVRANRVTGVVDEVTVKEPVLLAPRGEARYSVALLDYGYKRSIADCLTARGCAVTLYPARTPAEQIIAAGHDGVMLSNGPGDPAENTEIIAELRKLYDSTIPIFGVCMGHQLLALATGAKTGRLAYGHRGGNHPVRDLEKERVFITSQNHGYMVLSDTVDPAVAEVSHINVNDGTCEGLKYKRPNCFTTQFHPEANAGPKDTEYLFNRFIDSMGGAK